MITATIFPGRYIQGKEAIKILGKELLRLGKKGLIICDAFVLGNMSDKIKPYIHDSVDADFEKFGGECSDEEIDRLLKIIEKTNIDFIAGLGGGKTLDTAKTAAWMSKRPVAVVPTIAATDAPCSALSVIYTPTGEFKRYQFLPGNPDLVLVDTEIIANAPVRLLVSGMGDALATWFEAESCMKKYAPNMTGYIGSMSAYSLAKLCYESLLKYGVLAKSACEANVVTPAFEHVVEANTLLSGLGFESGGLAASHAIHNGLTVLEQTHHYFHGEKVAFGTLASLFLTDKPSETINEVYGFCEDIGLPTSLAEIGLSGVSDSDLMKASEASCTKGETIHNELMPVTSDMVFSAIKAADAEGRKRKACL